MDLKTAIIVDDESYARSELRKLILELRSLKIICECDCGLDAIEKINQLDPDIVFLDIEMPDIDGFQVMENIDVGIYPHIIIVTAFTKYALKAFEFNAIDYLYKPFSKERLKKALDKVFEKSVDKEIYRKEINKLREIITTFEKSKNIFQDRFIVKDSEKYSLIHKDKIIWIESDGNYVQIFTKVKKYFVRHSLTGLKEYLNEEQFFQISRSVIVNIEWVTEIKAQYYGNYIVKMKNGDELKMTKNYKSILDKIHLL